MVKPSKSASPGQRKVTPLTQARALLVADVAGLTPREVAVRYRVSAEKVRKWIERGELRAINTADTKSGKPRYVVPVEALAEFEQKRAAAAPKPAPVKKPRGPVGQIDFFP